MSARRKVSIGSWKMFLTASFEDGESYSFDDKETTGDTDQSCFSQLMGTGAQLEGVQEKTRRKREKEGVDNSVKGLLKREEEASGAGVKTVEVTGNETQEMGRTAPR